MRQSLRFVAGRHYVLRFSWLTLLVAMPFGLAAPARINYKIDAQHSQFLVTVAKTGLFKAFGHNHTIAVRDFSGTIQTMAGTLAPATLQITIPTNALAVVDQGHASDRPKIEHNMQQEVLESAKYPAIVFKSTQVTATPTGANSYQVKIWGNLTLHNVTRPQVIEAQVITDGHQLTARGGFALRQTDFGIKPVSAVGGAVKVKNEVKLTFDIAANRSAE